MDLEVRGAGAVYGMFLSVFSVRSRALKCKLSAGQDLALGCRFSRHLCVWEFLVLVGHIEILDKLKQRTNTHFCMKNFIDQ